jgi:osmoprotectant transport system substrate-binding protein
VMKGCRILIVGATMGHLAACGASGDAQRTALDDDAITVGSFDFEESMLVAEIYGQALERAGIPVERAFGLGSREFAGPAMRAGLIEVLPEYAGSALSFVSLGADTPSADGVATHSQLVRALAGTNVMALAAAPAQDANTFAVTRATARRFDLHRLSDLARVAGQLRLGGPAECPARPLCALGLRERYQLEFGEFVVLDAGGPVTRQALRNGDVDVALMLTSDPALAEFVALDDDRQLQPAENVTPIVRTEVIDRFGARVADVLDAVSSELDTDELRTLNAADAEQPGSADVAAIATTWLESKERS